MGLPADMLIPYGYHKAKINIQEFDEKKIAASKLILVTAITPTKAGIGKTTTSVGLADGLKKLKKNVVLALREPSLGPCFGMKGGAAGGGYSQVIPMEEINLHFNGDFHAITAANNTLAALLDNYRFYNRGKPEGIKTVLFKRCLDVNDRVLRKIVTALDTPNNGIPSETGFVITPASEIMAVLCLSEGLTELRQKIDNMLLGFTFAGNGFTTKDLGVTGAITALLKDAIQPNLVQTLEGTPAMIHGGPFANIAHGCNSLMATKTALQFGDYVVTEAGFATDLGAEKFFNIKCRTSGLRPDAGVVVATLRALKLHGGGGTVKSGSPLPPGLTEPNQEALERGFANLEQHIANVRAHGVPVVVAVNAFKDDSPQELDWVCERALAVGASAAAVSTHWADGGKGAEELARAVVKVAAQGSQFKHLYDATSPIKKKIETIATTIYGAAGVSYSAQAEKDIESAVRLGFEQLPICMAKTPLSLSHDPALKGRPSGFTLPIQELRILSGAGFLTAVCSGIQLMPGLPKKPAGERIDIDPRSGEIVGLA